MFEMAQLTAAYDEELPQGMQVVWNEITDAKSPEMCSVLCCVCLDLYLGCPGESELPSRVKIRFYSAEKKILKEEFVSFVDTFEVEQFIEGNVVLFPRVELAYYSKSLLLPKTDVESGLIQYEYVLKHDESEDIFCEEKPMGTANSHLNEVRTLHSKVTSKRSKVVLFDGHTMGEQHFASPIKNSKHYDYIYQSCIRQCFLRSLRHNKEHTKLSYFDACINGLERLNLSIELRNKVVLDNCAIPLLKQLCECGYTLPEGKSTLSHKWKQWIENMLLLYGIKYLFLLPWDVCFKVLEQETLNDDSDRRVLEYISEFSVIPRQMESDIRIQQHLHDAIIDTTDMSTLQGHVRTLVKQLIKRMRVSKKHKEKYLKLISVYHLLISIAAIPKSDSAAIWTDADLISNVDSHSLDALYNWDDAEKKFFWKTMISEIQLATILELEWLSFEDRIYVCEIFISTKELHNIQSNPKDGEKNMRYAENIQHVNTFLMKYTDRMVSSEANEEFCSTTLRLSHNLYREYNKQTTTMKEKVKKQVQKYTIISFYFIQSHVQIVMLLMNLMKLQVSAILRLEILSPLAKVKDRNLTQSTPYQVSTEIYKKFRKMAKTIAENLDNVNEVGLPRLLIDINLIYGQLADTKLENKSVTRRLSQDIEPLLKTVVHSYLKKGAINELLSSCVPFYEEFLKDLFNILGVSKVEILEQLKNPEQDKQFTELISKHCTIMEKVTLQSFQKIQNISFLNPHLLLLLEWPFLAILMKHKKPVENDECRNILEVAKKSFEIMVKSIAIDPNSILLKEIELLKKHREAFLYLTNQLTEETFEDKLDELFIAWDTFSKVKKNSALLFEIIFEACDTATLEWQASFQLKVQNEDKLREVLLPFKSLDLADIEPLYYGLAEYIESIKQMRGIFTSILKKKNPKQIKSIRDAFILLNICTQELLDVRKELKNGSISLEKIEDYFQECFAAKNKLQTVRIRVRDLLGADMQENLIEATVQRIITFLSVRKYEEIILELRKFYTNCELIFANSILDVSESFMSDLQLSIQEIPETVFPELDVLTKCCDNGDYELNVLKELNKPEIQSFMQWVNSNDGIPKKDLRTFLDLALISTSDYGAKQETQVRHFYDSVISLSEIIYKILDMKSQELPLNDFLLSYFKPLVVKLLEDTTLISKIQETAKILNWIKSLKSSLGSVVRSTLDDITGIIRTGEIKIFSASNEHVMTESHSVLKVQFQRVGGECITLSTDQVTDLQSQVMLLMGDHQKQNIHKCFEKFNRLISLVFRLLEVHEGFYQNCNMLCAKFRLNIQMSSSERGSMRLELQKCIPPISIDEGSDDIIQSVSLLCQALETALNNWKMVSQKERLKYKGLHYFSFSQISFLQKEMARLISDRRMKVDSKTLNLLGFLNPSMDQVSIQTALQSLLCIKANEIFQDQLEQSEYSDVSMWLVKQLEEEEGYNIEISKRAIDQVFRAMIFPEGCDKMMLVKLAEKVAKNLQFNEEPEISEDFTWETLDSLLIAVNCLGNTAVEKFSAVWEVFINNTTESFKDFICFRDLNVIAESLSKQTVEKKSATRTENARSVSTRLFSSSQKKGNPVLLLANPDEHISLLLEIFSREIGTFPDYEQVLVCSNETNEEKVDIFLRRSILNKHDENLYTIICAEKLNYKVSLYAEQKLNEYLNGSKESDSVSLIVIASSTEVKRSPFCNVMSSFTCEIPFQFSITETRNYANAILTNNCSSPSKCQVVLVTSQRCGMGKSLEVDRIAYAKKENTKHVFTWHEAGLPADELYNFLEKCVDNEAGRIFHLDIASNAVNFFDKVLIELFLFGAIENSAGEIWRRKAKDLFLLECTSPRKSRKSVLDFLPTLVCHSPNESLQCEAQDETEWSKYYDQIMMNSELLLTCYNKIKASTNHRTSCEKNAKSKEPTQREILETLLLSCGVPDPSWQELLNFVKFFYKQIQDMQQSSFLQGDHIPGFQEFATRFLLRMSKDFSSRTLDSCDTWTSSSELDAHKIRLKWEHQEHPFLVFNEDGHTMTFLGFSVDSMGNLIDTRNNRIMERKVLTSTLRISLDQQRVPLSDNFQGVDRNEKLLRLRRIFGYNDNSNFDPDPFYELTFDNVLKMVGIYMRFRCNIPVVLMGESGCGKTKLVSFLAALMQPTMSSYQNMLVVKVHGGLTEQMLKHKIKKAEELSKQNKENHKQSYTVLFLDEINITGAIGLVKEILCDSRIHGQRIDTSIGLRFVAACNPYRKHSESAIDEMEKVGLGYHVPKQSTTDRFGDIPMRHLVYRVMPLPESLSCYVWDFGNLSEDAECKYIEKMVISGFDDLMVPGVLKRSIGYIAQLIQGSQKFMRPLTDEDSFVSLREVERFILIFKWLYKNNNTQLCAAMNEIGKRNRSDYCPPRHLTRSLVISFSVCYLSRLSKEIRISYSKLIDRTQIDKELEDYKIREFTLFEEYDLAQTAVLENSHVLNDIARNEALKENVFIMTVCIHLRIPLFLIGKPGSSKSLAKTIVKSSMVGDESTSKIFHEFSNTHMISFQCSPWSTSESIKHVFNHAVKIQKSDKKRNDSNIIATVVLDEIGLAEDSPRMPLKILHPLLDSGTLEDDVVAVDERVAFVGISNWALDRAKMNRGITVCRSEATQDELIRSSREICGEQLKYIENELPLLANFYREMQAESIRQHKEFFGLRDFFSLIKELKQNARSNARAPMEDELTNALQRNFSGMDGVDPIEVYVRCARTENKSTLVMTSTMRNKISVIKTALKSRNREERFLLLITKNYTGYKLLLKLLNEPRHVIYGSNFPKDEDYTKVCRDINRIKVAMEKGETVILMNMDRIYESLYDVLNQYYEQCADKRFVDVGLGTHRLTCAVHDNFRIIIVSDESNVIKTFPLALINRLEKHQLNCESLLDERQHEVFTKVKDWADEIKHRSKHSQLADVFIGYNNDTIPSLVTTVGELKDAEHFAKDRLLKACSPEAVLCICGLPMFENDDLIESYITGRKHRDIARCIMAHITSTTLLQITTFDRLLTRNEINQICESQPKELNGIIAVSLNNFQTEMEFKSRLKEFLKESDGPNAILLIQFEALTSDYENLLACAKFAIEDELQKTMYLQGNQQKLKVVLVAKLIRSYTRQFRGFDCGNWTSVHLDELHLDGQIDVFSFLRKELPFVIKTNENAIDFKNLFIQCIHPAVAMLRGNVRREHTDSRLRILLSMSKEDDALMEQIRLIVANLLDKDNSTSVYSPKDWLRHEATKTEDILKAGTLSENVWRILVQKAKTPIGRIIACLDKNDNLKLYELGNKELWCDMLTVASVAQDCCQPLGSTNITTEIYIRPTAKDNKYFTSSFPFSWTIIDRISQVHSSSTSFTGMANSKITEETDLQKVLMKHHDNISRSAIISDLIETELIRRPPAMTEYLIHCLQQGTARHDKDHLSYFLAIFKSVNKSKPIIELCIRLYELTDENCRNLSTSQSGSICDLPRHVFTCFFENLKKTKTELNNPETRNTWLKRIDKAKNVVDRIVSLCGDDQIEYQWEKVLCTYFFVRHVSLPFDKNTEMTELLKNIIKPIKLWNGLIDNTTKRFNEMLTIKIVEEFLDDMQKSVHKMKQPSFQCSDCKNEKDEILRCQSSHAICLQCYSSKQPIKCNLCDGPEESSYVDVVQAHPRRIFQPQCNIFLMKVVHELCFRNSKYPPTRDLLSHFLTYISAKRGNSESTKIFGYLYGAADVDDIPVFRSYILQEMLKFDKTLTNELLQERLQKMKHFSEPESQISLAVLVVNCLEDDTMRMIMKMAEEERIPYMSQHLLNATTSTINIEVTDCPSIRYLEDVAKCRVGLRILAESIVKDHGSDSDQEMLYFNKNTVSEYNPRLFLLRCLTTTMGFSECMKLVESNATLHAVFIEELEKHRNEGKNPNMIITHSSRYLDLVKKILTMSSNQDIEFSEDENKMLPLVLSEMEFQNTALGKYARVPFQRISDGLSPREKIIWTHLSEKRQEAVTNEIDNLTALLLMHYFFVTKTMSTKPNTSSMFVDFLLSLSSEDHQKYYLPAMQHDETFEILQGMPRTQRYVCPNGHPYVIGECGKPMALGKCADCGAPIGGANHRPTTGNRIEENVERSMRGYLEHNPSKIPTKIRNLNPLCVAILRSLQCIAIFHKDDKFQEKISQATTLISKAAGKNIEDSHIILHVVIRQLSEDVTNESWEIESKDGRETLENKFNECIINPAIDFFEKNIERIQKEICEHTNDNLRRLVFQDPAETSANEAAFWRYRELISLRHVSVMLSTKKGEFKILRTMLEHEHILREMRYLPKIVTIVKDLVQEFKFNITLEDAIKTPASPELSRKIAIFAKVWNNLRQYLNEACFKNQENQANIFLSLEFSKKKDVLDSEIPLAMLLPHKNSWGTCVVALIQLLVNAHNKILDAANIGEIEEISLEVMNPTDIIQCDPETDLLPILLQNCHYSFKVGDSTTIDYRFEEAEQQLLDNFIKGQKRLSKFVAEMMYKEEFNVKTLFEYLSHSCRKQRSQAESQIGSDALPTSLRHITRLMEDIIVATRLLASGGQRETTEKETLHVTMTTILNMPNGLPKSLETSVTLGDVRSLWLALDHRRWQLLTDDNYEPYKLGDISQTLPNGLDLETLKYQRIQLMRPLHELIVMDLTGSEYYDFQLNESTIYFPSYDTVFKDMPDDVLFRHTGELWARLYKLHD